MSAVQTDREIETKLTVPEGFEVPPLGSVKGVDSAAVRTLRLKATYYDTADLRLARAGTTLRHRTGEGRPRWTLKVESVSGAGRDELSVPGPGTTVPVALQDLLTAQLRGATLQKVVELRTRRTSSLLFDTEGREVAEVVDDVVTSSGGEGWRELEVEQRPGGGKLAGRLVVLLEKAGATAGSQASKAVRALGPAATAAPDLPDPGVVRRKDPASALVRWSLRDALRLIVEHDLGVRRDLADAVHQMRVSCRRLRSDLRTFRTLLDEPRAERLREELAWLADSFGGARDLEVLRERLRRTAGRVPPLDVTEIDALLAAREQVAVAAALEALQSTRYLLLLQLLHDVASDPGVTELASQPCDVVLPELVERSWKHVQKRAKRLHVDDHDHLWHRARILAKRARYAAESAEVALGKEVRGQVQAAKHLQTVLGEHQDAAIAEQAMLDLADAHPADHRLAVLCGRLAERERQHVLAVRRDYLSNR